MCACLCVGVCSGVGVHPCMGAGVRASLRMCAYMYVYVCVYTRVFADICVCCVSCYSCDIAFPFVRCAGRHNIICIRPICGPLILNK